MPLYALIMAGGAGTRLWPRSRRERPKQLLDIVSQKTMLQETYERIKPLISDENIFIVTNNGYVRIVREQIPQVPPRNVIGEPEGHGTAPCIGLAALYLKRLDPKGVMIALPADHIVRQEAEFRHVLQAAVRVAEKGYLVTLGIKPSYPEKGYGYIQQSEVLMKVEGHDVYRVRKFTEKPDRATAEEFVQSGEYYWNSGIFVWKISTILGEIQRLMPDLYAQLQEVEAALGTEDERAVLEWVWKTVRDETVDFGIMEKAKDVALVPADIGWSDIGSWAALFNLLPADEKYNNVVIGDHMGVDTTDSFIYSPRRLIATVGIKGLVIVDADDVVLICPRERAQEVRALVNELRRNHQHEYL
jgi:mannose-1-phosphate guanylyltransferase